MSFFVADHSPMLKVLVRAVEACQQEDAQCYCAMAQVANLCCIAAATSRYEQACTKDYQVACLTIALPLHRDKDPSSVSRSLRAMTSAILVFDHTSPDGAFRSKSDLKVPTYLLAWIHRLPSL